MGGVLHVVVAVGQAQAQAVVKLSHFPVWAQNHIPHTGKPTWAHVHWHWKSQRLKIEHIYNIFNTYDDDDDDDDDDVDDDQLTNAKVYTTSVIELPTLFQHYVYAVNSADPCLAMPGNTISGNRQN